MTHNRIVVVPVGKDEEVPYMTRKLPRCEICWINGKWSVATGILEGKPLCEKHMEESNENPEALILIFQSKMTPIDSHRKHRL